MKTDHSIEYCTYKDSKPCHISGHKGCCLCCTAQDTCYHSAFSIKPQTKRKIDIKQKSISIAINIFIYSN